MLTSVLQGNYKADDKTIHEYQKLKSSHKYYVLYITYSKSCRISSEGRHSEAGGGGGGSQAGPWSKEDYHLR